MNEFEYASRKCIERKKIVALLVRETFTEIGYCKVWHINRYLIISPFRIVWRKFGEFLRAGDEYHQDRASLLCCKIILKGCGEYAIGQYLVSIIESKDVASALGECIDVKKYVLPRIHRERGEVVTVHIFLQIITE